MNVIHSIQENKVKARKLEILKNSTVNMELLKNDFDLLIIPKDKYAGFEERLTPFYQKENDDVIGYLARNCFMKQRC